MERKERRHYTREFKLEAVRLAAAGDKSNGRSMVQGLPRRDSDLRPMQDSFLLWQEKENGPARGPPFFGLVEVARIELGRFPGLQVGTFGAIAPLPLFLPLPRGDLAYSNARSSRRHTPARPLKYYGGAEVPSTMSETRQRLRLNE